MSGGVTIKGHYYAVVVERKPRVAWLATEDGVLAIVYEGATTPWSWASLPGLWHSWDHGDDWVTFDVRGSRGVVRRRDAEPGSKTWLTSERRPEGQKP